MLKHGEKEELFKDEDEGGLRRKRKELPKFLKEKPTLDIALIFYWDSFLNLNTERLKDYGSIPYTKMIQFCQMHKISEVELFVKIIKEMDRVFIEYQSSQLNKNKAK